MTTGTLAQQARLITAGKQTEDKSGFLLTLDDRDVVFTADADIANAAKQALDRKTPMVIELEARPGGQPPVVIELRLAPKPVAETPATGMATRPAQAAVATTTATPALRGGMISDPRELTAYLAEISRDYNVISPTIAVSQFAPGYGVNLVVVRIDHTIVDAETGRGTDTYYNKKIHEPHERAMSKTGLLKISQALGIQWAAPTRLDDGKIENYWRWQYYGTVQTYDGQQQPLTGSRELDLRTGKGEAVGMSDGQLRVARSFGNEICETKAMERAIRNFVRQTYTVAELDKPFLIPRFSFTPDMSDPAIKLLVTQRALDGRGALYPPPPPQMPAHAVETGASAPALAEKADPFAAPAATASSSSAVAVPGATADFVMPEGARFVAGVKQAGKGTKKDGKPWVRYEIAAKSGESWMTFSETHKTTAEDALRLGWPVRIEGKENEKYPDQTDMVSITLIDPRQGDLLKAATDAADQAGY